jgi:hypothetical protein
MGAMAEVPAAEVQAVAAQVQISARTVVHGPAMASVTMGVQALVIAYVIMGWTVTIVVLDQIQMVVQVAVGPVQVAVGLVRACVPTPVHGLTMGCAMTVGRALRIACVIMGQTVPTVVPVRHPQK